LNFFTVRLWHPIAYAAAMGYVFARLMRTRAKYAVLALATLVPLGLAVAYYSAGGIPTDGGHDHWNPFGSRLVGAIIVFAVFAGFLALFTWVSITALRVLDEGIEERRRSSED
jgi:uncharacterized BrkB/YihY/UPF0761 family membrane protein